MLNLTLLTDFYELTMMQGYSLTNTANHTAVFDIFYRKNPSGGGYAIAAGLEQAIDYIQNLCFTKEDIDYLSSLNTFDNKFLDYLKDFKFSGEIYAVAEGSVIFPNEPIFRVKAPIIECQLMESALLNIINHQSLIATKAARVCWAAQGDVVMEFGLRRAQGPDASLYGARAAIIGGCNATSNVLTGKMFNVPVKGTHAHSWVMSFDNELTAFEEYAKIFPDACTFLVDTYDTLKSGIPNAITVFKQMQESGIELKSYGIRLDSGDFAYLSKEARKMLDEAGFKDASICVSSDLDEYLILDLKGRQGAKINSWGVGTRLITSDDCPSFGGVYKLAAQADSNGKLVPRIKISENPEKVTNPGVKKVFRLYDSTTNKIKADLITLEDETIDTSENITLFDPFATWKRMTLYSGKYTVKEILIPIFKDGKCVYKSPSVMEIQQYCKNELDTLWDEHKRFINPQTVPVDLSRKLYDLKQNMINNLRK